MAIKQSLNEILEDAVEQFELAWESDCPKTIEQILVSVAEEFRRDVLVELIRIEMELRFQQGQRVSTRDYLDRFPLLENDLAAIGDVAFEEYRQRVRAGESVNRNDWAQAYGIKVDAWPKWDASTADPSESGSASNASQKSVDSISPQEFAGSLPQIGSRWHGFEIVGQLGKGAFGSVYLARQESLAGRLVVLKFTPPVSEEPQFLARLQHTNIVPVYSVHPDRRCLSICMPFLGIATLADVSGYVTSHPELSQQVVTGQQLVSTVSQRREETVERNLSDPALLKAFRSRRSGAPVDLSAPAERFDRWTIDTVSQILDGLDYAHRRGIVHGDLKPANILLSDEGEPILLDFHLAQLNGQQLGAQIGGTLPYMAPEQLRSLIGRGSYDHRADLFSVGVILHELLTGTQGLKDATTTRTDSGLEQTIERRIDEISRFVPDPKIHSDLRSIIIKATANDPADRYASAEQMRDDLERHRNNLPLKYAPNRSWKVRVKKWMARHPRLSSAASVGLLSSALMVVLAVGAWANWNRLERIEAIQQHRQRLQQVERLKVPLTMARWVDPDHIQQTIHQAEALADLFPRATTVGSQAPNTQNFRTGEPRHLSPDQIAEDRAAVAELHFWLAEALRQQALVSDHPETLMAAALQHNDRALAAFPGRGLWLQRAELLDQAGQTSQADEARKNAESTDVKTRIDRYLTSWLNGRDDPSSIQSLEQLIAEDPLDYSAWLMLGHVYAAQRRFEDAAACYTVCLSLDPEQPAARLFRGMTRLESGRFHEALADFDAILQRDPLDSTATLNRALALMRLGRWNDALAALNDAIENGAKQTRIWYLRSQVRRRLGDQAGAQHDLEKFLDSTPDDPISWVVMGNSHIDDDPQQAIRDYEQALKLDPDSLDALNNLAHVHSERLGDNRKAIEIMNRVVALDVRNPKRYCDRGVLFAREGDRAAALRDARSALSMRRDAEVLYRVAGIYAQTSRQRSGDAVQALNCLAAAIAQNPQWVASRIADDPDLEPIRRHERFTEIVEPLEKVVKNATFGGK